MSEYGMKEFRIELMQVADIVFSRGEQRVVRSIPTRLQDMFVPIMREVLCLHKLTGKSLMDFVGIYIHVENGRGTRFFLQDEKNLVHTFLENATRLVTWKENPYDSYTVPDELPLSR